MKHEEPEESGPVEFNLRQQMMQLSADVLRVLGPLVKRFDDLVTTDRILREGNGETTTAKGATANRRGPDRKRRGGALRSYRRDVIEILRESDVPLTLQDIQQKLAARGIEPRSRAAAFNMMFVLSKKGLVNQEVPSQAEKAIGMKTTYSAIPAADAPKPTPAPFVKTIASTEPPKTITALALNALRKLGSPATLADVLASVERSGEAIPAGSKAPLKRRLGWALTHEVEGKRIIKKGIGTDATYRLK